MARVWTLARASTGKGPRTEVDTNANIENLVRVEEKDIGMIIINGIELHSDDKTWFLHDSKINNIENMGDCSSNNTEDTDINDDNEDEHKLAHEDNMRYSPKSLINKIGMSLYLLFPCH